MCILPLSEEIRCSEVGVSSIIKPSVDFEEGYKIFSFLNHALLENLCVFEA